MVVIIKLLVLTYLQAYAQQKFLLWASTHPTPKLQTYTLCPVTLR